MGWESKIDYFEATKMWFVAGYYTEEREAFLLAEKAWEKRQYEGWQRQKPRSVSDQYKLDIVDDYFRWNVINPDWYLHKDGSWHKSIQKFATKNWEMSGEFSTYEMASNVLKSTSVIPKIYEDYENHLACAAGPISCEGKIVRYRDIDEDWNS
jgi:hypothetical protein